MSKNVGFIEYLLGVGSYLSIFAIYMFAFSVLSPVYAETISDEARIESAAYATYTPSMAARGQRFYVGP
jgi:hypothetical protein